MMMQIGQLVQVGIAFEDEFIDNFLRPMIADVREAQDAYGAKVEPSLDSVNAVFRGPSEAKCWSSEEDLIFTSVAFDQRGKWFDFDLSEFKTDSQLPSCRFPGSGWLFENTLFGSQAYLDGVATESFMWAFIVQSAFLVMSARYPGTSLAEGIVLAILDIRSKGQIPTSPYDWANMIVRNTADDVLEAYYGYVRDPLDLAVERKESIGSQLDIDLLVPTPLEKIADAIKTHVDSFANELIMIAVESIKHVLDKLQLVVDGARDLPSVSQVLSKCEIDATDPYGDLVADAAQFASRLQEKMNDFAQGRNSWRNPACLSKHPQAGRKIECHVASPDIQALISNLTNA